jgi:hypothetical protein
MTSVNQLILQYPNYIMPVALPKETIRRISHMHHSQSCFVLQTDDSNIIKILVDISEHQRKPFKMELESWTGLEFEVLLTDENKTLTESIQNTGIQLLPSEENPIDALIKRAKQLQKK